MSLGQIYIPLTCLVILLGACQADDNVGFERKKKPTSFGNGQDANANADGTFGTGQFDSLEEPANYPTTEYFGSGVLNSVDANPIQSRIMQKVNQNQFTNQTLSFTSSDSNVNKEVMKLVGSTNYQRIPKDKIFELERTQGFVYLDFLMYAQGTSSSTGFGSDSANFSSPLPFLVIPSDKSRYDVLSQQPVSYQINVTGSGGGYSVSVGVELVSATDNQVQIRISANIPEDTDGRLYDRFPLAQSSTYHIDTNAKKIMRVDVRDLYYNSHRKRRKDMSMTFNLCKFTQNGKVETFPCGG